MSHDSSALSSAPAWVHHSAPPALAERLSSAAVGLRISAGAVAVAVATTIRGDIRAVGAVGYDPDALAHIEAALRSLAPGLTADGGRPVRMDGRLAHGFPIISSAAGGVFICPIRRYASACGFLVIEAGLGAERSLDAKLAATRPFWSDLLQETRLTLENVATEAHLERTTQDLYAARVAIDRLTGELEELNRAKEQFIANVNYELRAPLTAILGFCEVLRDTAYGPLNPVQVDFLQQIEAGGQELMRVVNDLMSLSRLAYGNDALTMREFDAARLFASLESVFAPVAARRGVKFAVRCDAGVGAITGDEERLREAVSHLLDNAFKFTPTSGEVWLTGDVIYGPGGAQSVEISVQDTGIGITPEQRQRVFQAFAHAEASFSRPPGLGVGLAIAGRIVALHGARLALESEPNQGSRFSFALPQTFSAQARYRPLVMVLESSRETVELLRVILEAEGFDVFCPMTEGTEGTASYAALVESVARRLPDVLVLDTEAPYGNGFDICQEIKRRESTRHIPILMLTVKESLTEKLRGLESGATDVLAKPVNRKELTARLRALISQKREYETILKEYTLAQRRALTDGLTGLFNHSYFAETLDRQTEIAHREGQPLTIILFDVDRFKLYNDTNGHEAGNALLRELAHVMERSFRRDDFLARYGGEEFVILLPNTSKEQGAALAERLRKRVEEQPFEGRETQPHGRVTISLGVASMPTDADTPKDLLELVDRALYRAKDGGRNRVCVVESDDEGAPKNSGFWRVS
jgi:diguanylate cyclase (GGDEF)-like protein